MNKRKQILLISALSILLWISSNAQGSSIIVFTTLKQPVVITETQDVEVFYLDKPRVLKAQLSRNLPRDIAAAEKMALKRMNNNDAAFIEEFGTAYQGLFKAWSLGVEKTPAIVIDEQFVVYGQVSVEKALERVRRFRASSHEF